MKKSLALAICIFSIFYLAQAQQVGSTACKKFEDTLKIIENVIGDINSDPHYRRIAAIYFLEMVTKIPYEGRVTFIGPEFPTESYFIKCRDWYLANKEKLGWDPIKEKIFLKVE